ncbi:unnamed protein product, partial [Oppiella nova]
MCPPVEVVPRVYIRVSTFSIAMSGPHRPVGCHRYQRDIPDIFDRHDDDVVTFDEDLLAPEDCRLTAIIDFANNWLLKREVWDVISCETVGAIIRVKFSKGGTVTYKKLLTTYSINDEGIL